jgi:hypothetical protein
MKFCKKTFICWRSAKSAAYKILFEILDKIKFRSDFFWRWTKSDFFTFSDQIRFAKKSAKEDYDRKCWIDIAVEFDPVFASRTFMKFYKYSSDAHICLHSISKYDYITAHVPSRSIAPSLHLSTVSFWVIKLGRNKLKIISVPVMNDKFYR